MIKPKLPKKLYKYRVFNIHTLRLLTESNIYYAKPNQLNDPLDCKPTLEIDADSSEIEKLFYKMLKETHDKKVEAMHDEYSKTLKIIKNNLSKTNNGKEFALGQIYHHRHYAEEYGKYDDNSHGEEYYNHRLASIIKDVLYEQIGEKGVLSLCAKWNCPLMWSHYADEHRGICVEYDMTDHDCKNIKAVKYDQPISIKVSDIIAWKNHSIQAEDRILDIFFYSKAPQWHYEEEWRDIKEVGECSAPFKISAIYFGLCCDVSIKTTIIKLFAGSEVKFYEVITTNNNFDLQYQETDTDYYLACGLKEPNFILLRDLPYYEADS